MAYEEDPSAFERKVLKVLGISLLLLAYLSIDASKRREANVQLTLTVRNTLKGWLNWPFITQLDSGMNDSGLAWRLLPLAFCCQTFITGILLLLDGKYLLAVNATLSGAAIMLGITHAPRGVVLGCVRMVSLQQIAIMLMYPNFYSDPASIKRSVFSRGFGMIAFFDDLGEAFLHLLISSIGLADLYTWSSDTTWMPLSFFCRVVVPVHFLGVREYICASATAGGINFGNLRSPQRPYYLSVIMVVPVAIVLYTMMNNTTELNINGPPNINASIMTGVVHLVVGFIALLAPQAIDSWLGNPEEWRLVDDMNKRIAPLGPLTLLDFIFIVTFLSAPIYGDIIASFICFLIAPIVLLSAGSRRRMIVMITYIFVSICLQAGGRSRGEQSGGEHLILLVLSTVRIGLATEKRPLSCLLRDSAFLTAVLVLTAAVFNSTAPHAGFLGLMSSCLAMIISWGRLVTARMLERERESAAFLAHAVKQKFCGVGGAVEDVLARMDTPKILRGRSSHSTLPSVDENMALSDIPDDRNVRIRLVRKSSLLGPTLFDSSDDEDCSTLDEADLTLEHDLARSFDEAVSKRNSLGWYVVNADFVGEFTAAVRSALSSTREKETERRQLMDKIPSFIRKQIAQSRRVVVDMRHILRIALGECRQGERLCHAVNVASNMSNFRGHAVSVESASLAHQFVEWQRESALFLTSTRGLRIEIEPGLLLKTNWEALKLTICTWTYCASLLTVTYDALSSTITFKRAKGRRSLFSILKRLARSFGGQFKNENVLEIPRASVIISPLSPSRIPRAIQYSSSTPTELPQGLTIAVLDDNALVRRHVERVCQSIIKADREKSFYVGGVLAECEDFPARIVRESVDIALFDENLELEDDHLSGTALAEKARELGFKGCAVLHSAVAADTLELPACFDGYVEKGIDRAHFCVGLAKAFYSRNEHKRITQRESF